MTLQEQYQLTLSQYAPLDKLIDAIMIDENKAYISLVIQLLRDLYNEQAAAEATDFVVPDSIRAILDSQKPY